MATMPRLTFAFCTYNRADRLPALVSAMRSQSCPVPFEILAVDNNSSDDTQTVLRTLARADGAPLRAVREPMQGITHARNRALQEAADATYLAFIDDDELPHPGMLEAAVDALQREGADCAGGRVHVDFEPGTRPRWLTDDLLGFLAQVDYGPQRMWITEESTPIWTANVAYRMSLFTSDLSLRFDDRYNRAGKGVGGGEDVMMFRALLARRARIRYRPDMQVDHAVEAWRLRRRYFLHLHYVAGWRTGQYELPEYERTIAGIPPFMLSQAGSHLLRATRMILGARRGWLRQAMNFTHAAGMIAGYRNRAKLQTHVA